MGRRPTLAQQDEARREHLADHPYDTAVARGQPQDPDQVEYLDPEQDPDLPDDDEIWEM